MDGSLRQSEKPQKEASCDGIEWEEQVLDIFAVQAGPSWGQAGAGSVGRASQKEA
jgi:hypothetical protein